VNNQHTTLTTNANADAVKIQIHYMSQNKNKSIRKGGKQEGFCKKMLCLSM
jgi:hypothetical protein